MDNASKALIMVGAILISVMLISLGVFLFTYARGKAEEQTQVMDATTIAAFNEQFLSYCGAGKAPSTAKAAISLANATKNTAHVVTLVTTTTAGAVDSTKTYTITEGYDQDGYINQLTIAPN